MLLEMIPVLAQTRKEAVGARTGRFSGTEALKSVVCWSQVPPGICSPLEEGAEKADTLRVYSKPVLGVRSSALSWPNSMSYKSPRARINKKEKAMTQTPSPVKYLGTDCAKASFDSHLEGAKKVEHWSNSAEGVTAFVDWINDLKVPVVVIVESTGGYERRILRKLFESDIAVALVDPLRTRHFAKSEGIRSKTDPIDAKMLTKFGREKNPSLWQPCPKVVERLRQLVLRRRQLSDMIAQEKIRLEQAEGFMKEDIEAHIPHLQRRLKSIEEHIEQHLYSDPALARLYERLKAPKGIGPVTAYTTMAILPELGSISDKRAASLAGLAPYVQKSGTFEGKAVTAGGRRELRHPLHMAAKSAIKHNRILGEFYQNLIARGKDKRTATTAVMRKLVVLMNKIAANPEFNPFA